MHILTSSFFLLNAGSHLCSLDSSKPISTSATSCLQHHFPFLVEIRKANDDRQTLRKPSSHKIPLRGRSLRKHRQQQKKSILPVSVLMFHCNYFVWVDGCVFVCVRFSFLFLFWWGGVLWWCLHTGVRGKWIYFHNLDIVVVEFSLYFMTAVLSAVTWIIKNKFH